MTIQEQLASFRHRVKIQIRFKDIDKLGHVNNANHLTYLEISRVEYFNEVVRQKIDWVKTGMILAKCEISYKQPILLEDKLYCYSKVTRFGNKSFDIDSLLVIENGQEPQIAALAKVTLVCMDYVSKQTIEIPKEWIEVVNAYESNK